MTKLYAVKSITTVAFLIGMMSIVALYSCKSFKKANLSATPDPIEVHADSIKFNVRAVVPPKSGFHKKKGVYMGKVSILGGDGKDYPLTNVTLTGKNYPDIKKNGASTSVEINQPFDEGMDRGKALVKGQYSKGSKMTDLGQTDVAKCCITTSRLVCTPPELASLDKNSSGKSGSDDEGGKVGKGSIFIFSTANYNSAVPVDIQAKFEFPQNVFDLQPNEFEKQQIRDIGQALKDKNIVEKIEIAGFASPEGTLRRNTFLSIQRYKEVQKWLIEQLKAQGYKEEVFLDSSKFTISHTSEDWEGFKGNLEQSSFSPDIQKQILQILGGAYETDLKERKIMALVGGARIPEMENLLSPLRRTTIRLKGKTSAHTDAEIKGMLQGFLSGSKSIDSLKAFFKENSDEMLYGINLLSSNERKLKLFNQYILMYPKDHRGFNDLGIYYLKAKDYQKGVEQLEAANKAKPNDFMVLNNLGIAYLLVGRVDDALIALNQANNIQSNPASQFVIAYIMLKKGQYAEAAELFDKVGDKIACAPYNGGLCKLLLNDLPGAKDNLESYSSAINPKNPLGFYLLAIVGAHGSDINMITLNLKKSVQLDSKLSSKASNDLEFRDYHSNEEFKAALKP